MKLTGDRKLTCDRNYQQPGVFPDLKIMNGDLMKTTLLTTLLIMFFIMATPVSVFAKTGGKQSFAVSGDGSVYLLHPSEPDKVWKFDKNSRLIDKFGDEGPASDQLLAPIDMVWFRENLYILDKFGPQVKIFTSGGKFISAFGKDFPDDQRMKNPIQMRIQYSEAEKKPVIYILDPGLKKILKFDLEGRLIEGLDLPPDHEKYFQWMTSFNVEMNGKIRITVDSIESTSLKRILSYDEAGFPQDEFVFSKIAGVGLLSDILLLNEGHYMIADKSMDKSSAYTGSIMTFDQKNEAISQNKIYDSAKSRYYNPVKMLLVDPILYVMTEEGVVVKLDDKYNIITKWE
jgi:hypothetical protein